MSEWKKQDSEEDVRLDKPFDISSAEALERQHMPLACSLSEERDLQDTVNRGDMNN